MNLENISEVIQLSTIVILVAILILGIFVACITMNIQNDIIKKLNEIDTKIDKLSDEVKIKYGTFLD